MCGSDICNYFFIIEKWFHLGSAFSVAWAWGFWGIEHICQAMRRMCTDYQQYGTVQGCSHPQCSWLSNEWVHKCIATHSDEVDSVPMSWTIYRIQCSPDQGTGTHQDLMICRYVQCSLSHDHWQYTLARVICVLTGSCIYTWCGCGQLTAVARSIYLPEVFRSSSICHQHGHSCLFDIYVQPWLWGIVIQFTCVL